MENDPVLSPSPLALDSEAPGHAPAMAPASRAAPVRASGPVGRQPQGELLDEVGSWRLAAAKEAIQRIAWHHSVYRDKTPADVLQVRRQFMQLAPGGVQAAAKHFNSMRRVHRLAWSIGRDDDRQPAIVRSPFLGVALDLVRLHYCPGMLLGLFDALLKHWKAMAPGNKEMLTAFIDEKVRGYSDRRISLQNINENEPYYTRKDGDTALAEVLYQTDAGLSEVWRLLQLPDHVAGYEYFSQVGLAYTDLVLKQGKFDHVDHGVLEIINFLRIHQNDDVSKKCLCRIISGIGSDSHLLKLVQASALELIGDPVDESRWSAWEDATQAEAGSFEAVRLLVGRGITRRLIGYFFEDYLSDEAKKRFWLKYTDRISKAKIYCSQTVYGAIGRDGEMRSYIPSHFGLIRGAEGGEAALVLKVKDHLLIESFTERPAFFAWQASGSGFPGIESASISLTDLDRLHEMQPLLQRRGESVLKHKQEGKITDRGVRTSFLTWWLRHHLGV